MSYMVEQGKRIRVNEEYVLHPKIEETLKQLSFEIQGTTTFTRIPDLANLYTRLFYAKVYNKNFAMALVGIEDLDEGMEPDGWTDILLPIFYGVAPNQAGLTKPLIFIDALFSGAYTKKMMLNGKMLMTYSVEHGLRILDKYPKSVGYIEYDLETGNVLNIID